LKLQVIYSLSGLKDTERFFPDPKCFLNFRVSESRFRPSRFLGTLKD
jgi:hypothetical protein